MTEKNITPEIDDSDVAEIVADILDESEETDLQKLIRTVIEGQQQLTEMKVAYAQAEAFRTAISLVVQVTGDYAKATIDSGTEINAAAYETLNTLYKALSDQLNRVLESK